MDATSLTVEQIQARLAPVFARYDILIAILFGSVARGEPSRHSDVDLILVQATTKRFFERYDGLLYDLNASLPEAAVEVLIYTLEEFERMKGRRFIARAIQEGRVIYEHQ